MNPYDVIELMHRMTEDDIDIIRKEFWPTVEITEDKKDNTIANGYNCDCGQLVIEHENHCPECGSKIIWNV